MTTKEKCELAIQRGYYYDEKTGLIYNCKKQPITNRDNGYIRFQLKLNKKPYNIRGHQFAWYYVNKQCVEEIDHINGIRYDNRICNLRAVTKQQNQWNRTKAKGYHWHMLTQKYAAQIRINKKAIHLGLFNTEEEAQNAYLQAKEIYHKI